MDCKIRQQVIVFALGLLVSAALPRSAYAEPLPPLVAEALFQREQRLDKLTFHWQITQELSWSGASADTIAALQKSVAGTARKNAAEDGIEDAREIEDRVRRAVASMTKGLQPFSFRFADIWRFTCDGDNTLATGTMQWPDHTSEYRHFYQPGWGLVIEDASRVPGFKGSVLLDPINVWASPGNAVRFRNSFQQGLLDLQPEDFVLLAGKDPLAMYGVEWDLVSVTPESWVVEGQVEKGPFSPFTIRQTLSRKHGGVPSHVQITIGEKWFAEYHVRRFQQHEGQWVCAEVAFIEQVVGQKKFERNWVLKGITPSLPVVLTLPKMRQVDDYRLLGQHLTTKAADTAKKLGDSNFISYSWQGKLPTQEEPKDMVLGKQQGSRSAAGLAQPLGAVMLLTGGIWSWRRRDSRMK